MMEVARVLRLDLLIKLSLAVFLGGIIGFERELSGKPAGLRTNILICLGAALLMDVSNRIGLVDGQRPLREFHRRERRFGAVWGERRQLCRRSEGPLRKALGD
jgi:hypothetical protein